MSETNETRLAQYAEAIWGKADTNAAARAVMAVADVEQADYVAIIERLTSERDKAREDCGFQKGLKESIREELSTFIRLKAEAEAALVSEREAHAALRARLSRLRADLSASEDAAQRWYSGWKDAKQEASDEAAAHARLREAVEALAARFSRFESPTMLTAAVVSRLRTLAAEPAAPVAAEEGGER